MSLKVAGDRVAITNVRPVTRAWIATTYYSLPDEWDGGERGVMAFTCWDPELGAHMNWVHSFPDVYERELRMVNVGQGGQRFVTLAEFLVKFDLDV